MVFLYNRLFVDEAYDPHLACAFEASKWIDFPDLLDAFTPHQLRDTLWLVVSDIDDSTVFDHLILSFSLFQLLPVSAHPVTLPAIIPD